MSLTKYGLGIICQVGGSLPQPPPSCTPALDRLRWGPPTFPRTPTQGRRRLGTGEGGRHRTLRLRPGRGHALGSGPPGAGPPPAGSGRFEAAPPGSARTRALTISRPRSGLSLRSARGCATRAAETEKDGTGRDTSVRAGQVRTGARAAGERWTRDWSAPSPGLIGRRPGTSALIGRRSGPLLLIG